MNHCYEHNHMTPAEYGMYCYIQTVSLDSHVFYFDGRTAGDEFEHERGGKTGKSTAYRLVDSLCAKGWLKLLIKGGRNKVGVFTAAQYSIIRHGEWAETHPKKCRVKRTSPLERTGKGSNGLLSSSSDEVRDKPEGTSPLERTDQSARTDIDLVKRDFVFSLRTSPATAASAERMRVLKDTEDDDDEQRQSMPAYPPTQDGGRQVGNIVFDVGGDCVVSPTALPPVGGEPPRRSPLGKRKTKSTATDAQGKLEITIEHFVQSWKAVRIEDGDVESSMSAGMPRTGWIKLRTELQKRKLSSKIEDVASAFRVYLRQYYIPAIDTPTQIESPLAVFTVHLDEYLQEQAALAVRHEQEERRDLERKQLREKQAQIAVQSDAETRKKDADAVAARDRFIAAKGAFPSSIRFSNKKVGVSAYGLFTHSKHGLSVVGLKANGDERVFKISQTCADQLREEYSMRESSLGKGA